MSLAARSATLTLALAASLALAVDATSGVGAFVDCEGAFLKSDLGARTPGSDLPPSLHRLDPAAAGAATAALLRTAPVARVDADTSEQVRPEAPRARRVTSSRETDKGFAPVERRSRASRPRLLVRPLTFHHPPPFSFPPSRAQVELLLSNDATARPGAVLAVRLLGVVDPDAATAGGGVLARAKASDEGVAPREFTSSRRALDADAAAAAIIAAGCDATVAFRELPGDFACDANDLEATIAAVAAEAGATATSGGSGSPGGSDVAFAWDGDVTLRLSGDASVGAFARELACFVDAATRWAETSIGDVAATLAYAEVGGAADVVAALGDSNPRAEDAAGRLARAAARLAIARAGKARGGKLAAVALTEEAEEAGDAGAGAAASARRRLQADDPAADPAADARRFANLSVATVVGVLIFVIAFCGILAMLGMTFPSDSLLYPREKSA